MDDEVTHRFTTEGESNDVMIVGGPQCLSGVCV